MLTQSNATDKAKSEAYETIDSRFGPLKINLTKTILFPYGLPGIPGATHYHLADFPMEHHNAFQKFKVLQSTDDQSVSFLVLPIDKDNLLIDTADIEEACKTMAIPEGNLLILLITSIHRSPDSTTLSVNTRAPVLIDVENQVAAQYIFMNNKYDVRHMIGIPE